MWKLKEFKTYEDLQKFIAKNKRKIQYNVLFLNNAYGIEYRRLRRIY